MESDLAVGLLRLMISVIAKDQHPETAPKKNVGESSYKTVQAKFYSLLLVSYVFLWYHTLLHKKFKTR